MQRPCRRTAGDKTTINRRFDAGDASQHTRHQMKDGRGGRSRCRRTTGGRDDNQPKIRLPGRGAESSSKDYRRQRQQSEPKIRLPGESRAQCIHRDDP
eukprot:scaffold23351_cov132-Cyclotella_meneghiniana.AAC.1